MGDTDLPTKHLPADLLQNPEGVANAGVGTGILGGYFIRIQIIE